MFGIMIRYGVYLYQQNTHRAMKYTEKQIEAAKRNYTQFAQFTTVAAQQPEVVGHVVAEQRAEYHNRIVSAILAGDQAVIREWKTFFLNEEVKKDRKAAECKNKLAANKEASADILAPIKAAKRIGEFGKWLNTPGNPFRKEHFSKKYTQASVDAFLSI